MEQVIDNIILTYEVLRQYALCLHVELYLMFCFIYFFGVFFY